MRLSPEMSSVRVECEKCKAEVEQVKAFADEQNAVLRSLTGSCVAESGSIFAPTP